jgi:hypothetical protein
VCENLKELKLYLTKLKWVTYRAPSMIQNETDFMGKIG